MAHNVQPGDKLTLHVGQTEYQITVESVETVTMDVGRAYEEWLEVTARSGVRVRVPYIQT